MLNTNLKSMFLYTKYATPYLKKTHGVIVNTSSISGVIIIPDFLDYSVAKAGVIHLTKASAIELTKMNIRVNCICPGPVNTPMLVELSKHPSSTTANPMNRIASPEEIANVALFLVSSDSSFITGQAVIADGGYTVI
jgi:NAD(P)-dependent dehydrogenase (short-subunit alcohol dehydrogenase family)